MQTRDIDTPHGLMRVTIEREPESISDPRDWAPNLTDADVAAWRADEWEFVTVTVNLMHYCAQCRDNHLGMEFDSLGMVFLGSGDGWDVRVDDLINTHPVPDMVTELGGRIK